MVSFSRRVVLQQSLKEGRIRVSSKIGEYHEPTASKEGEGIISDESRSARDNTCEDAGPARLPDRLDYAHAYEYTTEQGPRET